MAKSFFGAAPMSRFNAFLPDNSQPLQRAPRPLLLARPTLFSGVVGLTALFCASVAGLTLAGLYHPLLALRLDPMLTAGAALAVCIPMLAPVVSSGLRWSGIAGRAGAAFLTIGLMAPAIQIAFGWWDSGLRSAPRLATVWAEGAPSIAVSAGLHGLIGAGAAVLAAAFVCRAGGSRMSTRQDRLAKLKAQARPRAG
jgi:hypothetical protein